MTSRLGSLILILSSFIFLGYISDTCATALQFDLHGDVELDATGYADSVSSTNSFLETDRLQLNSTTKYGKEFRLKINPLFQADPLNDSKSERYWVELPEGYLQFQKHSWTIQAGYNTFTWGVTDGYNPLDIVSARRFQDPLKSEKLGAPSLSVKKDLGQVSFEGIYIPSQRESVLPGNNSRWLPRDVYSTTSIGNGVQSAELILPSNLNYFFLPSQELNQALENNVGLRMQIQSLFPGLDASLEGFEGAAVAPAIDVQASGVVTQTPPSMIIQANPFVQLTPVYYRQRVYGGTLAYANFGMIFKFETAITRVISKGADLPGSAEEYVLGAERPITIGSNDLTLLLQATRANHTDPLSNSTTSLNRIFDRALILGARYPFSEKLLAMVSGVYDTESHGEMAHAETSYNLTDAWKIGLAGDLIWGSPSTPLGSYGNNDRVIGSVRVAF